ncbi:hypothetical protein [Roseivivax sediminis]|nr:hypothetical protein [Roseivivax sediminis]
MQHRFSTAATVAASVTAGLALTAPPARAYQIDCAILLCLSGGWPTSAPCTAARAEFIRRITPWPIEPPLQIWRCPMGVAFRPDDTKAPSQRLYEIAFDADAAPLQSRPMRAPSHEPLPAILTRATEGDFDGDALLHRIADDYTSDNGIADIDISDPAFDFVRSITVYSVERLHQREAGGDDDEYCLRYEDVRIGRYGLQGDFYWQSGEPSDLPDAYVGDERWGDHCPTVNNRAVFVEWSDYQGNFGYEQVNY